MGLTWRILHDYGYILPRACGISPSILVMWVTEQNIATLYHYCIGKEERSHHRVVVERRNHQVDCSPGETRRHEKH